ncbi:MAG: hypothetical protein WD737_13725, partial [Gemmatimonadota bacterium]
MTPRHPLTALWLVATALLAAVPASGQEPPDTIPEERPFVAGGIYDKPYLTRLLGRTVIGGYGEVHARWERADGIREERGFELKRWNLFTSTQVNDFVRAGAELEIEELAEEITLEYAAIDVIVHPAFTIRGGAILSPLGRFNLSHDSPRNEFTDRPLVSTEIIGTALTDPGLGALGQLGLGRAGRVTYEVYAVNGYHAGVIEEGPGVTRIPAGKRNTEDNNGSPAFVGRMTWSPRFGYELGLSGYGGAYNVFELDGERVAERNDVSIYVVDMEADLAGVVVSGEAALARIDIPPGMRGIFASGQRGLYLQAVREVGRGWVPTMPGSFFEIGSRLDLVDFDDDLAGDSARLLTVGLNFRPTEDAALKLDFFRGRNYDRFNNLGE